MLWLSHHVPTEILPQTIKEIARTVKTATDIDLFHQDRDAITSFPNSKNLINLTRGTPPETALITAKTLEFASQIIPQTTNET